MWIWENVSDIGRIAVGVDEVRLVSLCLPHYGAVRNLMIRTSFICVTILLTYIGLASTPTSSPRKSNNWSR